MMCPAIRTYFNVEGASFPIQPPLAAASQVMVDQTMFDRATPVSSNNSYRVHSHSVWVH